MMIMDSVGQDQRIVVQIAKKFKDVDVSLTKLRKLVEVICKRFKLSRATVSIAIVDDAEIRKLNKRFLDRNAATDCLSFDLSDLEAPATHLPTTRRQGPNEGFSKVFELVVNGQKAVKEANVRGLSPEAELALYITHSLLHNLGFDDSTPEQAEKMHHTEDEILQQQGFGLVYNMDAGKEGHSHTIR